MNSGQKSLGFPQIEALEFPLRRGSFPSPIVAVTVLSQVKKPARGGGAADLINRLPRCTLQGAHIYATYSAHDYSRRPRN